MTRDETLAYQRGYNRGMARLRQRVADVLAVAKAYREKSRQGTAQPRCDGCARWTRGSPGNCLWGHCNGQFEWTMDEPGMWTDRFAGERQQRQVVTHEHFGCVNWVPRQESGS